MLWPATVRMFNEHLDTFTLATVYMIGSHILGVIAGFIMNVDVGRGAKSVLLVTTLILGPVIILIALIARDGRPRLYRLHESAVSTLRAVRRLFPPMHIFGYNLPEEVPMNNDGAGGGGDELQNDAAAV